MKDPDKAMSVNRRSFSSAATSSSTGKTARKSNAARLLSPTSSQDPSNRVDRDARRRPVRAVEVHAQMHARGGDFEGRASEKDARTAFQVVTRKLLAQKRNQKAATLGSRRDVQPRQPAGDWY